MNKVTVTDCKYYYSFFYSGHLYIGPLTDLPICYSCLSQRAGWLGEAKVLCLLHHWGVQLILTCSWARPAILAAGKGRGVEGECFYFFCFFTVIHFPFSSIPLFHLLYYLSSPFLWETTQNDPQGLTCR